MAGFMILMLIFAVLFVPIIFFLGCLYGTNKKIWTRLSEAIILLVVLVQFGNRASINISPGDSEVLILFLLSILLGGVLGIIVGELLLYRFVYRFGSKGLFALFQRSVWLQSDPHSSSKKGDKGTRKQQS